MHGPLFIDYMRLLLGELFALINNLFLWTGSLANTTKIALRLGSTGEWEKYKHGRTDPQPPPTEMREERR